MVSFWNALPGMVVEADTRQAVKRCLDRHVSMQEKNSCPECRDEFTDRALKVNRALARLSEKARTLSLNTEEKESKLHCEEHQEELKLFCETDKKLICLVCRVAREHKSHSFIPIKEAVAIYKDQVKSSIQSLTTNKSAIQEMEEQQKQKISQVREQSQSLKSHVTSQFAELHQILVKKEQRILGEIKEDEEKILSPMEKNLQDIQENLNSIEEELSKLQGRMEQTDIVSFLKEEAGRKRRISDESQTLSLRDGAILDERFKHLFWLNAVLREPIVAIHQVSVTLDVETAHALLEVSEDRKRDALQSHVVEHVAEEPSNPIHPTADPQESEEEKIEEKKEETIEQLEEQLLEDLSHVDPIVITHPLREKEEVSFVSRTGKTNDFTKLKGWKQKLQGLLFPRLKGGKRQHSGSSISKQNQTSAVTEKG
ncbi:nuclear factor 7, brain-like [Amblyraja radiata]|uniref:nuclear factor 7, brain-like n=1 Tax=Amblyraja radiata TaxID=386614 RepID=UPI001401CAF7|nr:nuclear factor 7, brain-like [Amblyraja radiata]